MDRHFLLYWNWETVERELAGPPALLAHGHSNQLGRVAEGDVLWIVSVPPRDADDAIAGSLMLVGRLCVGFCTDDRDEAIRQLGTDDFWEARWHAGAAPGTIEPYQLIRLDDAAGLRFAGERDRLTLRDDRTVNPQQLQTMRELRPESAATLDAVWQAHRSLATGHASFEVPDDADPADLGQDLLDRLSPDERADLQEHIRRERSPIALHLAKQMAEAREGHLICAVCGFDFAVAYGSLGEDFIEAHHTLPLDALVGLTSTDTDDLALVCSNCHRMLHRGAPQLGISELRDLLSHRRGPTDASERQFDDMVGDSIMRDTRNTGDTRDDDTGEPTSVHTPYQRALEVAIAAAQEAGALLREAFLRPGGPDGAASTPRPTRVRRR